jgi:hypothetical protein
MAIIYRDKHFLNSHNKYIIVRPMERDGQSEQDYLVVEDAFSLEQARKAKEVLNDHEKRNGRNPDFMIMTREGMEEL